MNVRNLLTASAVIALAACSDYDPGLSENAQNLTDEELAVLTEYTQNFTTRYGAIDPDHDWGFGEIGTVSEAKTRAMDVGSHQWSDPDGLNLAVPGFPQATDNSKYSGKYFVEYNTQYYEQRNSVTIGTDRPAGDVTDEEILYVSAWFRTHPNPKSDTFNQTNYFVQAISGDKDREDYGTMSGEGTDSWKESAVYDWVTEVPIMYTTTIDGEIATNRPEGQPEEIKYNVDHLNAPETATATDATDHVLNFNWGRTNVIGEKSPSTTFAGGYRTITYVHDTGSQIFSVENSNTNIRYDRYVIKHLTFDIGGKHYDGYYLAFDYEFYHEQIAYHEWECEKYDEESGQNVPCVYSEEKAAHRNYDGYYSNYIVKLSGAGQAETVKYQKRVMCEDLGNTDDFDFNDLVFDVYYEDGLSTGSYTAHVLIQAAGGTLPIYVGPNRQEAHEVLGGAKNEETDLYAPLNVGLGSAAPKEITFTTKSTNPDDIDIYVTVSANKATNDATLLPKSVGSQYDGTSAAPQKICVPVGVAWPTEHQQIETKYPNFRTWVADKNVTNWYENAAEGF